MRLTFLFRAGRRQRLAAAGEMPTEFFYGYPQLKARGIDVHIVEDAEIGLGPSFALLARPVIKISAILGGLPIGMALSFAMAGGGRRLAQAGMVIATTNSMGLALAIGKALGIVKAPVLLLAMGLVAAQPGRFQKYVYTRLTRRLHLACISKAEQIVLRRVFSERPVHYIPFGVDTAFWRPAPTTPKGQRYVLAIGNDPHRDWATLVAAWGPDLPHLKIVTSLPVPPAPPNVEVIRGDWRSQVLSDTEIRDLYCGADFVVVPLRETVQPSGQSACLQAMACGKAVILSDIAGLWDRELIADNDTVVLSPAGDVAALAGKIRQLNNDSKLAERLGRAARHMVEVHLNVDCMAQALLGLVESLHV